jgi:hypothetical protein
MTIDEALQNGETIGWQTDMWFMRLDENKNEVWSKGKLTFTDQGIYWNDEYHLPYSRMKMISFFHHPLSNGLRSFWAKFRGGGTIEVPGDIGSTFFEFGNSNAYYKALGLLSKVFINEDGSPVKGA